MKKFLPLRLMFIIICMPILVSSCTTITLPETTPSPEPAQPVKAVEETALPLSDPGPYPVGIKRNNVYLDDSRGGREVTLTLWYPAESTAGAPGEVVPDAPPDLNGAPYPVILSSSKLGFIFASSLVSHGFTYVGVNKIDTYFIWDNNLIDQPLDILFALRMAADNPPVELEGVINSDIAGTTGYSFDGYNSLAMSGARINPLAYLARCDEARKQTPPLEDWYLEYLCTISANWEDFESHAGPLLTNSTDGLWQPMTDARIKAVLPMGPDGAWIFNEQGLAAVDRPILILNAEKEEFYTVEAAAMYEQIGFPEKYLITFKDRDHMMVYDAHALDQMKHFANAFFGYYLQGNDGYKEYFSEEFVSQVDDLAWGVYQNKSGEDLWID